MSSTHGLQAALAHLLVEDQTRGELRDAPRELQRRFGLTDAELMRLRRLNGPRLALTAQLGRAKRLDFLRRGLPTTLSILQRTGCDALLAEFARTTWMPVESRETSRVLSESRRFVSYLATVGQDKLPRWLHEVAAFELGQLDLAASNEADAWSRRAGRRAEEVRPRLASRLKALRGEMVVLGGHVRVWRFEHDVVEVSSLLGPEPPRDILPTPTYVTMVRRPVRPLVAVYRTGEVVASMLLSCLEPRPFEQLLAAAGSVGEHKLVDALCNALSEGILVLLESDAKVNEAPSCASAR